MPARFLLSAIMVCAALQCALSPARAGQTEYVFLVTADGLRHQELFTGADRDLLLEENKKQSGIQDVGRMRELFWAETAAERRATLMPFFWNELAPQGIVLGNRELGSRVSLRNTHRFSYPGYAEILNGQAVAAVDSNDARFSPRRTVLEYLREKNGWEAGDVAVFGSWRIFNWIAMEREGAVFCNAGHEGMPEGILSERGKLFDRVQFEMLSPWDTVRHDLPTLELALDYVKEQEPECLYLALGETDDWAHDRRYDRVLETARFFDDALRRLWTLVEEHPKYRGKTTLIITTDHGRGRTLDDWTSHGAKVEGAEEVWIAVIGPDTPNVSEVSGGPEYSLSNVVATLLQFYGLKVEEFNGEAEKGIREAFGGE